MSWGGGNPRNRPSPGPPTPTFDEQLAVDGWIPLGDGTYFNSITGDVFDPNDPFGEGRRAGRGGGAGAAWLPGEYELAVRKQQADENRSRLDRDLNRYQIDADNAIRRGDQAEEQRANREMERINREKIALDREIAYLDYQLGQLNAQVAQRGQDVGYQSSILDYLLGGRGQDIDVRGQDISAGLTMLQEQYREAESLRNYALQIGDQQLAQDAENRMRYVAESANQLTQRGQDIDIAGLGLQGQIAANNQLIDYYTAQAQAAEAQGNLELARYNSEAAQKLSQQNIALDQYDAQLKGAGLGLQAQQSALGGFTDLAGIEQQRQSELQQLAANPRDWLQMQFALGGGESFLNQLLAGQPITGQSAAQAGETPFLGAGFEQLVGQLGQRPAFDAAMGQAGRLGEFQAPGAPELDMLLSLGQMGTPPSAPDFPNAPNLGPIDMPNVAQVEFGQMPGVTYREPPAGQPIDYDAALKSIFGAWNAYAPAGPPSLPPPPALPPREAIPAAPAPSPGTAPGGQKKKATLKTQRKKGGATTREELEQIAGLR